MTADLAARIAETAAFIEQELAEDERVALATIGINERAAMLRGEPPPRWVPDDGSGIRSDDRYGILRVRHTWARERDHIIRHDPARALRHVKATRELVALIMSDTHHHAEAPYYSCSQAREKEGMIAEVAVPPGPPGSACWDEERAGQPCDCGRDAQVARLLGIIAGEWEGGA